MAKHRASFSVAAVIATALVAGTSAIIVFLNTNEFRSNYHYQRAKSYAVGCLSNEACFGDGTKSWSPTDPPPISPNSRCKNRSSINIVYSSIGDGGLAHIVLSCHDVERSYVVSYVSSGFFRSTVLGWDVCESEICDDWKVRAPRLAG